MKKQAITNLTMILWIFLIGSFFGFIYENLLMIIKGHPALRQGLIYEPLIPIYGIGSIVFLFILRLLLKYFYMPTYYSIVGFTVGSVLVLYTPINFDMPGFISILLLIFGLFIASKLTK